MDVEYEQSLVDPNVTRKIIMKKYSIENEYSDEEFADFEFGENDVPGHIPHLFIPPLDGSKYPHTRESRIPDYEVNDKVFRNGKASIGLGYYSIE